MDERTVCIWVLVNIRGLKWGSIRGCALSLWNDYSEIILKPVNLWKKLKVWSKYILCTHRVTQLKWSTVCETQEIPQWVRHWSDHRLSHNFTSSKPFWPLQEPTHTHTRAHSSVALRVCVSAVCIRPQEAQSCNSKPHAVFLRVINLAVPGNASGSGSVLIFGRSTDSDLLLK